MTDEQPETDPQPLPRYSGSSKVAATFHGSAQISTEGDERAVEAPSGVGTAEGAREARYAEAINHTAVTDSAELLRDLIDAVMAVADAEVAAAVSEARAEVERWRDKANEAGEAYANANSKHHVELDRANRLERLADTLAGRAVDLEDRARSAEAEVERLREGIRALADEWDQATIMHPQVTLAVSTFRALLSPSPAATTGEHDPHARLAPELVALLDDWDANDEDDNYSKGDAANDLRAALTRACGCERGLLPHDRRCPTRLDRMPRPAPVSSGEAATGEAGWRSRKEQHRIDNLPCPKCGGDRLRADFTDPSRCHVAPVVAPSDEGDQ